MVEHVNQIMGHGLMVAVYLAPLPGMVWGTTLKTYEAPIPAFILVGVIYILGHLCSAGVIR